MKLAGRRAIITGGSRGFGLAVAHAFVEEGASVMVCARDASALDRAREHLSSVIRGARVLTMTADVASPAQMRAVVETTVAELGGLDVLVCNAGIYGPKGPLQDVDWDEWTSAITVNLLGVALACRSALPHFLRHRGGKIVILSGGGATRPMPRLSAYAASKAAVVRLAETLAEEVRDAGIDVNALAPGAMNTRMLDEVLEAGPERVGVAYYQQALRQKAEGGVAPEVGARLCVFLASRASDGITGKLLSAVWDPWEALPEHLGALRDSDIYTLRRIVPSERGQEWGAR
jgi:3-oxoacyl-[acyl-carrier protein] reductase